MDRGHSPGWTAVPMPNATQVSAAYALGTGLTDVNPAGATTVDAASLGSVVDLSSTGKLIITGNITGNVTFT